MYHNLKRISWGQESDAESDSVDIPNSSDEFSSIKRDARDWLWRMYRCVHPEKMSCTSDEENDTVYSQGQQAAVPFAYDVRDFEQVYTLFKTGVIREGHAILGFLMAFIDNSDDDRWREARVLESQITPIVDKFDDYKMSFEISYPDIDMSELFDFLTMCRDPILQYSKTFDQPSVSPYFVVYTDMETIRDYAAHAAADVNISLASEWKRQGLEAMASQLIRKLRAARSQSDGTTFIKYSAFKFITGRLDFLIEDLQKRLDGFRWWTLKGASAYEKIKSRPGFRKCLKETSALSDDEDFADGTVHGKKQI